MTTEQNKKATWICTGCGKLISNINGSYKSPMCGECWKNVNEEKYYHSIK